MAMLKIYKSRLARIQYVFRDGAVAVFAPRTNHQQGHYLTLNEKHIAELNEIAVQQNHPHIYVDPEEFEVDEKDADPAVAMRNQIREEERAKLMAELGDPNQMQLQAKTVVLPESLKVKQIDAGETENKSKLGGIGNSTNMASTSAESNTK